MGRRRGFEGEEDRWICPCDVARDPSVNRYYEERRAIKIVKNGFDGKRARSAGYVVSERADGSLIWLDGQHRGAAAEMAGLGHEPVRMTVLTGLSRREEADWVLLFQEDRKGTPPGEAHRLGVMAKRPADLTLDAVCRKYGVTAVGYSGEGNLAAVGTARKIADKENGEELLDQSFECLIGAFGNKSDSFEAPLLSGMAYFWSHNNGNVDKAALTKKLTKRWGNPAALFARAKTMQEGTGRPVYREVASVIVGTYNKGRRSGQLEVL